MKQECKHVYFADGYRFIVIGSSNSDVNNLEYFKIFRCELCLEVRAEFVPYYNNHSHLESYPPSSVEAQAINSIERKRFGRSRE